MGTRYKALDSVLDRDENRESSSEIMHKSSKGIGPAVVFCWTVCWVILPTIIINNIFGYTYTHAYNYHKDFMLGTDCALEIN